MGRRYCSSLGQASWLTPVIVAAEITIIITVIVMVM